MNAIVKSLLDEARKLSPEEQLELVDEILAGIPPGPKSDQAWVAEAKDRYQAYLRGDLQAVELKDILAKYGRT